MSSPIRRPRRRALRPVPECLEGRQLLSLRGDPVTSQLTQDLASHSPPRTPNVISGTDIDGDTWTLRLIGPGDLRVTTQGGDGQTVDPTTPSLINTITVAGAVPTQTRLVGQVHQGANGDGRVFFQNLTEIGGRSETTLGTNGLLAVDMPGFWLGYTNPTTAPTPGSAAGSISIPDGVVTFRFGGVDTTAFFGGSNYTPLDQNNQSDAFTVSLGLPNQVGTSIILDKVVTSTQPAANGVGNPTADTAFFSVTGRINLFQANEIDGTPQSTTDRFTGPVAGGAGLLPGGTTVRSGADPTGGIPGQIGYFRVGGNATNLTVQVANIPLASIGAVPASDGKLTDFFIGGETNGVDLSTPGGSRNVSFGRGMDEVAITSHVIETLSANRGALNSTVTVDRAIGRATFGGDVVNSQVLAGYTPTSITDRTPQAQTGGGMTALVAGDVTNSVFAASVEPFQQMFGGPSDLVFPHGHINAKVEGTINNTGSTYVDPSAADKAFFAHDVSLINGPVIPPTVPEAPYPHDSAAHFPFVQGLIGPHLAKTLGATSSTTTQSAAQVAARRAALASARAATRTAAASPTPNGPASAFTRTQN